MGWTTPGAREGALQLVQPNDRRVALRIQGGAGRKPNINHTGHVSSKEAARECGMKWGVSSEGKCEFVSESHGYSIARQVKFSPLALVERSQSRADSAATWQRQ